VAGQAGRARQRAIAIAVALVVVMATGVALIAPAAVAQTSTGGTPVQAGINDAKDPNIAVLEFMPKTVTVRTGATVTWDWAGTIEPHSVTFTAPGQQLPPPGSDPALFAPTPPTGPYDGTAFVNSGLQPLGPTTPPKFSVTFAKAGSFKYYCVIHPNMIGTVKVVSGGTIDSAASATKRGKVEQAKYLAEGRIAKKKLVKATPKPTKNSDGSTTYPVEMGASTAHTDILAFSTAPKAMKAGDSIEFVNNSQAPHTGTFSGAQPQIQNPLDPRTDVAIPGPSPQTLDATDLFNSGLLPPDVPDSPGGSPPPVAVRSFTFVVPAAGNYPYYCILHASSGMSGAVSVT
jgi:plastocyanin